MNTQSDKFEQIRELLSKCPSRFCIIYRGVPSPAGVNLKWCKATSADKQTREEYENLSARYQEIALNSFENRRNFIIKETPQRANARVQKWCGMEVLAPTETDQTQPAVKPLGKRWWHLIVGAGAVRDAGYVVVTRVAATEKKELHEYIAKIQDIMKQ